MLGKCILFAVVLSSAAAYPRALPYARPFPQQQQQVGIPPHLLRQYLGEQQREATPIYEDGQQQQATQVRPAPRNQPQQLRFSPVQRLVQRSQQPAYIAPQQPAYIAPQQPAYIASKQPAYIAPQQYVTAAPQPAAYSEPRPRPAPQRLPQQEQSEQEDRDDYDPNPSYQFGFDVNDDQYTNYQNRKEQRDGNVIKGSYSVVDSDGFIRTVTYTADPKEGFKAEVTREPTDIVVKVPTPKPQEQQQQLANRPQLLQQQQPLHRQQSHLQQQYRYQ